MIKLDIARISLTVLSLGALLLAAINPAMAANTTSRGQGVKCTWVLISSVNNVNTYQQVCRKGV